MLYPPIQELLKLSTDNEGNERLNKYTLVMATAKCARMITNQCLKERKEAERLGIDKKDRRYRKEYKDEKAVRSAVKELNAGEYEILFPGDEGYDEAIVDVRKLETEIEELISDKKERVDRVAFKTETATSELMNATEEYEGEEAGYAVSDEPTDI
ncbi:MAG: hypothetical protein IJZ93_06535 [Clostridia bacterium]|nr:hypothetical protein [Clostridia bacterium]